MITAVTRLPRRLAESGGWAGTHLPLPDAGGWRDVLTGRAVAKKARLAELFADGPVALLVRDERR